MLQGNAFRHQIILPEQQAFYDYWRSCCKNGRLPSRHDICPSNITGQLPTVSLIERRPGPTDHRYRYRLAGTGFWNFFGEEITGRFIDELPISCRVEYWHNVLDRVLEQRAPLVGVTVPNTPIGGHMAQFWVRLPLSDNGRDINMILGYDHFTKLSDISTPLQVQDKIYA